MKTKPFNISKWNVLHAYKLVKANAGAAGVDEESLKDFEHKKKSNLYTIWNRLSSGSYFPPPVKTVAIPKKAGGERILGIPTVSDRIAQMVVKLEFEPQVEPYFLNDSYGYRPNKSAIDAVGVTRQRCWRFDWVLEFDIKGLFDNIPHDLLLKAVYKHTDTPWVRLYINRWLTAAMQMATGEQVARGMGTPQGGVISPVLSNLFLHYVFDKWLQKHYPNTPWCRYADDGLVHCHSEEQAKHMLEVLKHRFEECGLELHPVKTKIVYCKDGSRTDMNLVQLAKWLNPIINGWIAYYGRFYRSALYGMCRHVNKALVRWAMRKHKPLRHHKTQAAVFLEGIAERSLHLFAHWRKGMLGSFA